MVSQELGGYRVTTNKYMYGEYPYPGQNIVQISIWIKNISLSNIQTPNVHDTRRALGQTKFWL